MQKNHPTAPRSELVDVAVEQVEYEINYLMEKLAQHYLKRTIDHVHGNKTKAAELLGFSNYQTFTNWLKKYNVN